MKLSGRSVHGRVTRKAYPSHDNWSHFTGLVGPSQISAPSSEWTLDEQMLGRSRRSADLQITESKTAVTSDELPCGPQAIM